MTTPIQDALEALKKEADDAYCRYIDAMDKKCRGFEYKIANGKILFEDIKAHASANELLGQHRGIHHAVKIIAALTDKARGEWKPIADAIKPDDAYATSPILIAVEDHEDQSRYVFTAFWGYPFGDPDVPKAWVSTQSIQPVDEIGAILGWQPLPTPPVQAEEG